MRGRKPTRAMPSDPGPGYTCFVPPCRPIRISVRPRTRDVAKDSLDAFYAHYMARHMGRVS